MSSKVTPIQKKRPPKVHSEKLKRKYRREKREQSQLSPDFINEDLKEYCPLSLEKESLKYCVTKEAPFHDFKLVHEINLDDIILHFNSLLIYRILKIMYDSADIVAAFVDISQPDQSQVTIAGGAGIDWSYSLRLNNFLVAEIRSFSINTRQVVRFWSDQVPKNEKSRKEYGATMAVFLQDLNEAVSKNLYLFNEEELSKSNSLVGFQNNFAVKYRSALHLLELAENLDKPGKVDLKWGEKPEVKPVGDIFTAASLYFGFALEAFLNILYELFLYDEYRSQPYKRVTTQADLDIRLLTIHLFCSSFRKQAISKDSSSFKDLILLRDFRNNMVHGNLTAEHCAYAFTEDAIQFFYSPASDFRGQNAGKRAAKHLPLFMAHVNKQIALRIKSIVDEIVSNLVDAMTPETSKWVKSWLHELVFFPFLKKQ